MIYTPIVYANKVPITALILVYYSSEYYKFYVQVTNTNMFPLK